MTTTDLQPIALLGHELRHILTHDSGMLWRAIEPQPERIPNWACAGIDGLRFPHATYAENCIVAGDDLTPMYVDELAREFSPYQPGAPYYVQEPLYYDIEQGAFYAAPVPQSLGHPNGMKPAPVPDGWEWNEEVSDVPAESMPIEAARIIIEITQVEVKRAGDVSTRMGHSFYHDHPGAQPETWGFLYHYTVKERR